jgi:hypothetical protein
VNNIYNSNKKKKIKKIWSFIIIIFININSMGINFIN